MKKTTTTILMAAFLLSLAGVSQGANWPTWRGPLVNGTAPTGNPPVKWSEKENIKWKIDLPGEGSSTPVIWGDKMFFQVSIDTGEKGVAPKAPEVKPPPMSSGRPSRAMPPGKGRPQPSRVKGRSAKGRSGSKGGGFSMSSKPPTTVLTFDLVCLDRKTGKLLWQTPATKAVPHEGHHRDHGFASYSPVTDGKYVWANFGSRGMHCFTIDGDLKWSAKLPLLVTRAGFGEGSSPAIAGDAVIVVSDHEGDSFIFAFDKLTGKPLWKKARDERTTWITPVVVEVDGRTEVIVSATNFIRSYDAKTGDIIWQCSGQTDNVIPCPVIGFGMVFCTSGYRGNSLQAIELGRKGDLSGTDAVRWSINKTTPYVPSPLLYGDKIYFGSSNKPMLSCYDAKTGKANFVGQDLEGMRGVYASPVGAADRVYIAGREGATTVIKNSATFEVLAVNTLDDGFDASPVVVGDELYLKGKKSLYCIAE